PPRAAELPRRGRRAEGARPGSAPARRHQAGLVRMAMLDPAELARLSSMALRARVIVEGAYAGMTHNPHAGTSIEFAEPKEAAPGDDLRHMDWKAVARVERYYIKRFEDETEMRTFLLVDASASMGYG